VRLCHGDAALHLHDVLQDPPEWSAIVVPHTVRAPAARGMRVHRSRTLVESDVTGAGCRLHPDITFARSFVCIARVFLPSRRTSLGWTELPRHTRRVVGHRVDYRTRVWVGRARDTGIRADGEGVCG